MQVGRHATLRTKKKTEQEEEVCEYIVMYPALLSEAGVTSVTLDCYLLFGSQTVTRINRELCQSSAKHYMICDRSQELICVRMRYAG